MGYINEIKTKDGQKYDVQDKRIIEVTPADVGKVLTVEEDGSLGFKTPAGGGTKLYKHVIMILRTGQSPVSAQVINTHAEAYTLDFFDNNSAESTILFDGSSRVWNGYPGDPNISIQTCRFENITVGDITYNLFVKSSVNSYVKADITSLIDTVTEL